MTGSRSILRSRDFVKQDTKRKLLHISEITARITLFCLFLFIAYLFFYYGVFNKSDVPVSEPLRFVEDWTVSDENGNSFRTHHSFICDHEIPGKVAISATLPGDITDNESFYKFEY